MPTAHGVFLDALTACKPDGTPDWHARLRAAEHLSDLEAKSGAPDEYADLDSGWT